MDTVVASGSGPTQALQTGRDQGADAAEPARVGDVRVPSLRFAHHPCLARPEMLPRRMLRGLPTGGHGVFSGSCTELGTHARATDSSQQYEPT